jgi:transcriptional regulator with XRE-family HTH domain
MSLGQKIKHFRERAGLSQLALEMEAGLASPGHLSRIENGKKNPEKETLIDIAYALKLNTFEIASLFGVDLSDINRLFEETTEILSTHNLLEILDRTVNNLVLKIGYLASMILLVDGDKVRFSALTMSNIAKKTMGCLDKPLNSLCLSMSQDASNLTVKAIKENKPYVTHHTYKYVVSAVTKQTADKIQQVTGDKSNIIYPLSVNSAEPIGAIVYVKKYEDDFRNERETLGVISKQIAVAIQNAKKFEAFTNNNRSGGR